MSSYSFSCLFFCVLVANFFIPQLSSGFQSVSQYIKCLVSFFKQKIYFIYLYYREGEREARKERGEQGKKEGGRKGRRKGGRGPFMCLFCCKFLQWPELSQAKARSLEFHLGIPHRSMDQTILHCYPRHSSREPD